MRIIEFCVVIGLLACVPLRAYSAPPDPLADAVQSYNAFQKAAEITGRKLPRSGAETNRALKRLSKFKAQALANGWIAEGALSAASDSVFVSGVDKAISDAGGADAFAAQLETNPVSVMKIPGAGNGMRAAYNNIKRHDQFYDWLSTSLTNLASGRKVPKAQILGTTVIPRPKPGAQNSAATLVAQKILKAPLHSMGRKQELSVAGRIMVLAALDVAGQTQNKSAASRIQGLLDNRLLTGCLSLAKQNLGQCLAASRGKSERQFCAGQHAVGEVSRCFDWILPDDF